MHFFDWGVEYSKTAGRLLHGGSGGRGAARSLEEPGAQAYHVTAPANRVILLSSLSSSPSFFSLSRGSAGEGLTIRLPVSVRLKTVFNQ